MMSARVGDHEDGRERPQRAQLRIVTRPSRRRKFAKLIQVRAARVAVGPSTVRGQGPGVVDAARHFLRSLKLAQFGTRSAPRFKRELDLATKRLMQRLPRRGRKWGVARKVLNIFLRDALYTWCLRDEYHLERAEPLMEVPLDRITAKRLRKKDKKLPRWHGVRHLTPEDSALYQQRASDFAKKKGYARVHLDAEFWGRRRGD